MYFFSNVILYCRLLKKYHDARFHSIIDWWTLFFCTIKVHFGPDGVASQSRSPEGVQSAARSLTAALDALAATTNAQASQLEAALAQLDAYCADVAKLRAQLLQAEQQLRQAAQPNYSPRDPDRAVAHQQVSLLHMIISQW